MTRADLLIELGTEELPPKSLLALRDGFAAGVVEGLATARLTHGHVKRFATPRRLALLISGLDVAQPDQRVEHRGPPVRLAFDAEGMPTPAAKAFASKCGVPVEALATVATDKGEWLAHTADERGQATTGLLGQVIETALLALPIPRRMRWGSGDREFVRPVHWLVLLLGDTVVPATVLGLKAGRLTYGHRFHHPDSIELAQPGEYAQRLHDSGHVVASFEARRERVLQGAQKAALALGGEAVIQPEVLDEITALVEWPVAVSGRFADSYLRLPPEVLISTLQDHQRYFPVRNREGLMAAFIATSNLASRDPAQVQRGNERVVVPRLSDAAFFWDKDCATKLEARQGALKQVVYQQGLGSLHDKSFRAGKLAARLLKPLEADKATVARAAALARTDLLTDMVGEFPELQGRMGYYYARQDGEADAVAIALEEQYQPRHAGDALPETPAGRALAIADRLDTLAGIFVLGKRPSGSKDPFALRRQALGLVRILIECQVEVDLPDLLRRAVLLQPADSGAKPAAIDTVASDIKDFIHDRMRAWYLEGLAPGISRDAMTPEMFHAVLNRAPTSPLDFHQRLLAVQQFMGMDAAASLATANKRIANILRQSNTAAGSDINPQRFDADAETHLHAAVTALLPEHKKDLEARRYGAVLSRLATLREAVDAYFDQVMVMAEDAELRANRLAQLSQLRTLFLDVADISCISTA